MWLVALIVLLASCGGGGEFMPDAGPFAGQFIVDGTAIGSFTFTANAGALGGTGILIHNDQTVTVAISANIDGNTIDGTIENANLGSGSFTGLFRDDNQASGTFTYTDAAQITTQTGTWEAAIQ